MHCINVSCVASNPKDVKKCVKLYLDAYDETETITVFGYNCSSIASVGNTLSNHRKDSEEWVEAHSLHIRRFMRFFFRRYETIQESYGIKFIGLDPRLSLHKQKFDVYLQRGERIKNVSFTANGIMKIDHPYSDAVSYARHQLNGSCNFGHWLNVASILACRFSIFLKRLNDGKETG